MLYSPPALPPNFTSSTIASIDASNELTYTGFVLVVVSRNIDFTEAGNSNTAFGREGAASTLAACAGLSGLLANDLEPKGISTVREPSKVACYVRCTLYTPEAIGERRHSLFLPRPI